jgi:hypothetical protein
VSGVSKAAHGADDWLTKVPFIEGVSLRVFPSYYDGQLLRPKVALPPPPLPSTDTVH